MSLTEEYIILNYFVCCRSQNFVQNKKTSVQTKSSIILNRLGHLSITNMVVEGLILPSLGDNCRQLRHLQRLINERLINKATMVYKSLNGLAPNYLP